jgi:hypothetical protein
MNDDEESDEEDGPEIKVEHLKTGDDDENKSQKTDKVNGKIGS